MGEDTALLTDPHPPALAPVLAAHHGINVIPELVSYRTRKRSRRRWIKIAILTIGISIAVFLLVPRQPYARLHSLTYSYDNVSKTSNVSKVYHFLNNNFYTMYFRSVEIQESYCTDSTCQVSEYLGSCRADKLQHELALAEKPIVLNLMLNTSATKTICDKFSTDGVVYFRVTGKADCKLWFSGWSTIHFIPHVYRAEFNKTIAQ
eukprot:c21635_g1_i1.p1 GENE.c21635_g1_i1~~c21635_g1_i1.p1  ORF type:complete len:205 (+),score=31.66 c21635_g1_i1:31-645(+)